MKIDITVNGKPYSSENNILITEDHVERTIRDGKVIHIEEDKKGDFYGLREIKNAHTVLREIERVAMLVRSICAREFNQSPHDEFFKMSWIDDSLSADANLAYLFWQEKANQIDRGIYDSDEGVAMTLVTG